MLERCTARCIDTGVRPSAWSSSRRQPIQTRRILHSAFWHHGAGDLEVTPWCIASDRTLFEKIVQPPFDTASTAFNSGETPFLDFLYPPSTRDILQRPVSHPSTRSSPMTSGPARRYTSHTRQSRHATSRTPSYRQQSSLAIDRADRRDDALLAAIRVYTSHASSLPVQQSTPGRPPPTPVPIVTPLNEDVESLKSKFDFLKNRDARVTTTDAVDAYQTLPTHMRTVEMSKDLILFLAARIRSVKSKISQRKSARLTEADRHDLLQDAQHLVQIFESIPQASRDAILYTHAISAYLNTHSYGSAVRVHDEALACKRVDWGFTITGRLLYTLLESGHWQLLLHVYSSRRHYHLHRQDHESFQKWSHQLEVELCDGHSVNYPKHMVSFLQHLNNNPSVLDLDGAKSCVRRMVHAVYGQGLHWDADSTLLVLKILRAIGMSSAFVYEGAVKSATKLHQSKYEQHQLAMCFYHEYQQDYQDFKPTKVLLHRLLAEATKQDSEAAITTIVHDWKSHYSNLNNNAHGVLMAWRASRGEMDEAESELSALVRKKGEKVTWKMLIPLLHGNAMLGKPEAVEKLILDFQGRFGLQPNVVAYNTLMHAYLRKDDYTGLMTTFTRIIEAGLTPDAHTFGTVMALTARRGDVDLTKQFRRMASSSNIRSHVLDEELVLAHVNNDNLRKAEELAKEFTSSLPSTGTARMWTQILLGHAVRRDIRAALEISRQMTRFDVPLDQTSYAALMRVFIQDKRPQLARDLMIRMTDKDKLRPYAIHYAMLIQAYALESRFETAFRLYAQMLERGIATSLSVRVAMLQTHALAAKQKHGMDVQRHPSISFDLAEELLEEFVNDDESRFVATKEPQFTRSTGNLNKAYYFQVLVEVYGRARAHGAVSKLLKRFEGMQEKAGHSRADAPLNILRQLMQLCYYQREVKDVEMYWQLAKKKAVEVTTVARASKPDLPQRRRHLLARHLDIYIRMLDSQKRYDEMLGTFQEMVSLGFDLDYLNWNQYIYILVTRKRLVEAFVLCERNLMNTFLGWRHSERRSDFKLASGRKGRGLKYLGMRMSFVEPGTLTVTHTTMLHLSRVLRKLQADSLYVASAQDALDELQRKAPRTVEAALKTPEAPGGWWREHNRRQSPRAAS